ncbi:MAG: SurA N-terminal domain-containing protein, partial [Ralstonia sp.]
MLAGHACAPCRDCPECRRHLIESPDFPSSIHLRSSMLDFVRTHRRLMFLVLLILVFPSFVFFGVQSYSSFMDSSHDAAKVDGKVISTNEV